jgi:sugar-specific transcriptional regulator TrmB
LDLSRTVFDFQEYTIDSLIENALYKAEFNVYPEDGTYEMSYSFLPYEFMNLSNVNNIIKLKHKMVYKGKKEPQPINLAKYDIGSFSFVIYGFNLGAKILRPLHDRRTIKEYLKKHGGIYVYRELHRVYNYGSNENDWLNLDVARVNRPSEKFSNNTVMGFVKLKKDLSKSLIEKTNREGFIHNQAYLEFRKMVLQMFSDFEISAGKDRKRIEVILSSKKKNINKVNIEDALIKLEEVMLEYEVLSKEEFSNQLSKRISTVKKKYKSMKSLFINTAGKNLGVMMVFHDIEKQLRILIKHGKEEKILDSKFKNLLDSLESLLDFQKVLLSKPRISLHKVDVLVDTFINSIRLRLHDHNISLNRQVDSDLYIKIVENYFYRVLVNLFDNSIYWLKFKGGNKKNILIKAYEDKNFIHILFADNGSGFEDDPNEMVDPLMSRKEDGSGLGLYIVEQITNELNGYLSFPDWEKEKISDIYSNGALIKISIPKK